MVKIEDDLIYEIDAGFYKFYINGYLIPKIKDISNIYLINDETKIKKYNKILSHVNIGSDKYYDSDDDIYNDDDINKNIYKTIISKKDLNNSIKYSCINRSYLYQTFHLLYYICKLLYFILKKIYYNKFCYK